MRRDGENIIFDEEDTKRYPKLSGWMPVDWAPGMYGELSERRDSARLELVAAQDSDIQDVPEGERLARLTSAENKVRDFEELMVEIGRIDPVGIAELIMSEEASVTLDADTQGFTR